MFGRAIFYPLSLWRCRKAREAYAEALEASLVAKERGDTRSIHAAQRTLVEAQADRLRVGA